MILAENPNPLFPIFLRLEKFHLLVVGAGAIALEKLQVVLSHSPQTKITIVGITISDQIVALASQYPTIILKTKPFEMTDTNGIYIAIVAINDEVVSKEIATIIQAKKILCNVADKPNSCDFYLGSIVQKGQLKIAISTNGKSPTLAKRMKELFYEIIPDDIDISITQLQQARQKLKGDFTHKVNALNYLTKDFIWHQSTEKNHTEKKWKRIALILIVALCCMTIANFLILRSCCL